MDKRDYYEILGVSKSASADEIKKAYRKIAHKYHPDKGGTKEDEAKFKEANEAYQILSDDQKRKAYDQFGHAGPRMGGGAGGFDPNMYANMGGFGNGGFNINFDDLGGIGDIFEMFTGGGRPRKPKKGADIEVATSIEFMEMVHGTEHEILLDKLNVCDKCKGKGAETGSSLKTCPTCTGSGQVRREQHTMFGTFAQNTVCENCSGTGKVPEKPCTKCHGAGRLKERVPLKIRIPAGIESGQTIRVEGKGEAGPAGIPPGDLYVNIVVRGDSRFKRNGADIFSEAKISFPKAALGTTVDIETVDGKVTLKIPAGTQSGKTFKLTGHGLSYLHSSRRGDHLVTTIVETPTKLSRKQRQLLEEFEEDKSWF
jgi:molecular chaperone DnaJ